MRNPSVLIGWPLLVVLLVPRAGIAADTCCGPATPSVTVQSNGRDTCHFSTVQPSESKTRLVPARQASESATLEIGSQTSDRMSPDSRESQPKRSFRESQEDELGESNSDSDPLDLEDGHEPYLGIELEYSTQCYLGMEEHGFEVVSVDPNSPAARAGLIGRRGSTPWGDVGAVGSVLLLGPIAAITDPLLRNAGAFGNARRRDRRRGRRAGTHRGGDSSCVRPSQAGRYHLHHGDPAARQIPSHDAHRAAYQS